MLFEDRERAESFGAAAELYDRARPRYPDALIDRLLSDGADRVLDVGCGTGIVARLLAERGCDVLGVEPDPRMAAVASANGLAVEVAHFERWDDRGRRFALLSCGQAWHWIEPQTGLAKAAAVLRPGARIALFWNFGTLPPELRERLEAIYARLAPGLEDYSVALGLRDRRAEETDAILRQSPDFVEPEILSFPWKRSYTATEWVEQLVTHSDHAGLVPERREPLLRAVGEAIDAEGSRFEMDYEVMLATARRVPG